MLFIAYIVYFQHKNIAFFVCLSFPFAEEERVSCYIYIYILRLYSTGQGTLPPYLYLAGGDGAGLLGCGCVGVGGHVGAELGPNDHLGVGDAQPVRPLEPAVAAHPVPREEVAALGVLEMVGDGVRSCDVLKTHVWKETISLAYKN